MNLHRRSFLRAAGVAMALPHLDVLRARGARAAAAGRIPRRMVCINTPLGLHPSFFFPEKPGRDYKLSPYLEVLKDFRDDFTVISGLSHPRHWFRTRFEPELSDVCAASGASGGLQEQCFARSVRGRLYLRADAFSPRSHCLAKGRACRGQKAVRLCRPMIGRRVYSPSCFSKAAPRK